MPRLQQSGVLKKLLVGSRLKGSIRARVISLLACLSNRKHNFAALTFRFAEQDITGDVLLELDLDLLKTEIGIVAFGKRKRIANAITELKMSVEPESGAHSESFFSHTRSPSSAQGSSFNGISLLSSVPPVSTTGPPTPGGFYFSGSPDANSLSPDTPRSTRPRRESDTGSQENVEALNRTSSRNSFIGLGIQLTSKFQVIAVR